MTEPTVQTIAARVHGRYLVVPGSGPLVVGLHGYGENADRTLAQLRRVPLWEGWSLAAIQALHPFYNMKTSEVGASWMTTLDRELAIDDNTDYLRSVVEALRMALAPSAIFFVAYSQGAPIAWRAIAA